jgi:hypothetical protein
MTWVLIILVHVGGMSDRESSALTSVPGFASKEDCESAGRTAKDGLSTGTKKAATVCVAQPGPKAFCMPTHGSIDLQNLPLLTDPGIIP